MSFRRSPNRAEVRSMRRPPWAACRWPPAANWSAIRQRFGQHSERNQEGRREFGWQGERTTGGSEPMCDYSLHAVASRPATIGDRLVTTGFANTYTRGFAAVEERTVAVCLLPGTELAFDND